MMGSVKFAGILAAAVLATGLAATSASAVPVSVDNLESVDFGNVEFTGEVRSGLGGAGSWTVTFNASGAGAGTALVTIGPINLANNWTDLMVGWSGGESKPVGAIETTVSTIFADPDSLSQMLVISWTDSEARNGFDVEGTVSVSPIPLPAAGLLLLGGLGALGFAGRRKTV